MRITDKSFIFKTKIEVDKENFVTLREPTMNEFQKANFDSEDSSKNLDALAKLFPACVIDSTFTNDDDTPATGKEIAEFLNQSASTFTYVLTTWMAKIPFRTDSKRS